MIFFKGSVGSSNTFIGLQGNDTFVGNGGDNGNPDVVDYSYDVLFGATHGVVVNLSGNQQQGGLAPDTAVDSFGFTDSITGVQNVRGTKFADKIYGGGHSNKLEGLAGNDYIFGGGGDDKIFGGFGNDKLNGGAGNDRLSGSNGADWFIYTATNNGADIITDFSGKTAFGGGAGNGDKFSFDFAEHGTFQYRGGSTFLANGNTQARVASGKVIVDTDGNGAGNFSITVNGLTSANQLVAADFQFV
jgi:Ca2+-binding RTX toxin-like protein